MPIIKTFLPERSFKDIDTLAHSLVIYTDRYFQWTAFTYKYACVHGHVHTPILMYGYLHERAEKENSDVLLLSLK